jgi:hypothetical protein
MDRSGRWMAMALGVATLMSSACTSSSAEPGPEPSRTIPQPVVLGDLPVAPENQRVDIAVPSFSDATNATNPLHPSGVVGSALLLGTVDGKAFRTEVTLLPDTRMIEWHGQMVEALVSQYAAYLDGRLHEIAYDFYAQADDGSVWYLGEDVFNFHDGAIGDTHGTWIAGKDGPAAMIMPADPRVGDTYRPENIPGFVFEEVTVQSVDQPLQGPLGPIEGGLVVQELHMDGTYEEKTFAPGYGEYLTASGGDVEALALAVPTDAASQPAPTELEILSGGALDVFEAAGTNDWRVASATVQDMSAAWETFRSGDVPRMIEPRMARDLRNLADTVDARDAQRARQAAIDVAQWSFDLLLRYVPTAQVDLARFDLWAAQILVDAEAGDTDAVNGDFFSLDYIRDRIQHTLSGTDATRLNTWLEELQGAVSERDLAAAAEAAQTLREGMAGLR